MDVVRKIVIALMMLGGLLSMSATVSAQDEGYENSAEHKALIAASKEEIGLLVYSNIAEYNWVYILEEFKKKYPWMALKVETIDMGPSATFERYYSERSVNRRTADMVVTGAPDAWLRFVDKGGLLPYQSPLGQDLPEWSKPFPGLYAISTDPMIIIYNKMLLDEDEWPDELDDLAEWSEEKRFKNKIATYNATSHSFGLAIHWYLDKHFGDESDELFEELGSISRLENGGAVMGDKVAAGEYLASYFVSGITIFPHMHQPGKDKVLGWSLIKDGTPLFVRGMGVTKGASSPASAKLMMNFILSHEGQVAVGKGGLTPYRMDVKQGEVPYLTYADIVEKVGVENIIPIGYDREILAESEAFLKKWKKYYRLKD